MASVAVLLLGYSAMAYVNPLKRPTLHVAEIISLLLLPGSCVMVGYAIRVFVWRGKRLHSMRYRCGVFLFGWSSNACVRARACVRPCSACDVAHALTRHVFAAAASLACVAGVWTTRWGRC